MRSTTAGEQLKRLPESRDQLRHDIALLNNPSMRLPGPRGTAAARLIAERTAFLVVDPVANGNIVNSVAHYRPVAVAV